MGAKKSQSPPNPAVKFTQSQLAGAFTEWDRRFREDPSRFVSEATHLLKGNPQSYGEACALFDCFAQWHDLAGIMGDNEIIHITAGTAVPQLAEPSLDREARLIQMWLRAQPAHNSRLQIRDEIVSPPLPQAPARSSLRRSLRVRRRPRRSEDGREFHPRNAVGGQKFLRLRGPDWLSAVRCEQPAAIGAGRRELLNEHILSEEEIIRVILAGDSPRNRLLMEILYLCGLRVAELTGLRWKDAVERGDAGQLTVFGKGSKTRTLLVSAETWAELMKLRAPIDRASGIPASESESRIFPLSTSQVCRIVKKAAIAAGIAKPVSPHWFRHCFCSHAIDRSVPISLVQRDAGHSSVAVTSRYLHARPKDSAGSFLPKIPRRQGGER